MLNIGAKYRKQKSKLKSHACFQNKISRHKIYIDFYLNCTECTVDIGDESYGWRRS